MDTRPFFPIFQSSLGMRLAKTITYSLSSLCSFHNSCDWSLHIRIWEFLPWLTSALLLVLNFDLLSFRVDWCESGSFNALCSPCWEQDHQSLFPGAPQVTTPSPLHDRTHDAPQSSLCFSSCRFRPLFIDLARTDESKMACLKSVAEFFVNNCQVRVRERVLNDYQLLIYSRT